MKDYNAIILDELNNYTLRSDKISSDGYALCVTNIHTRRISQLGVCTSLDLRDSPVLNAKSWYNILIGGTKALQLLREIYEEWVNQKNITGAMIISNREGEILNIFHEIAPVNNSDDENGSFNYAFVDLKKAIDKFRDAIFDAIKSIRKKD